MIHCCPYCPRTSTAPQGISNHVRVQHQVELARNTQLRDQGWSAPAGYPYEFYFQPLSVQERTIKQRTKNARRATHLSRRFAGQDNAL